MNSFNWDDSLLAQNEITIGDNVINILDYYSVDKIKSQLYDIEQNLSSIEKEVENFGLLSTERHRVYKERRKTDLEEYKKKLIGKLEETESRLTLAKEIGYDLPNITAYRVQRSLAIYPFFSTCKDKYSEPSRYVSADGKNWLEINPNPRYGQATARDSAILNYIISQSRDIYRKEGLIPDFIPVTRYQLLEELEREKGGYQYRELTNALKRLCSTFYRGNIFGEPTFQGTLLSVATEDDEYGAEKILCSINPIIRAALEGKFIYQIPKEILFDDSFLRQEIAKRVWVHLGKQSSWKVSLERLAKMVGYRDELRFFRKELGRQRNFLEQWFLYSFEGRGKNTIVIFQKCSTKQQGDHQRWNHPLI